MKSLQILTREHIAIEAVLARLQTEVDNAVSSGAIDGEAVDRLLRFLEVQVDGHHQEKEERVFLPRLIACAPGEDAHAACTIFDDHGAQRRLLAQVRNQIEGAAYGEPNSLAAFARAARTYAREHREHSRWEQAVLFPLAKRLFRPRDDRAVLLGFRQLDELWGELVWEEARRVIRWLDQRREPVPA